MKIGLVRWCAKIDPSPEAPTVEHAVPLAYANVLAAGGAEVHIFTFGVDIPSSSPFIWHDITAGATALGLDALCISNTRFEPQTVSLPALKVIDLVNTATCPVKSLFHDAFVPLRYPGSAFFRAVRLKPTRISVPIAVLSQGRNLSAVADCWKGKDVVATSRIEHFPLEHIVEFLPSPNITLKEPKLVFGAGWKDGHRKADIQTWLSPIDNAVYFGDARNFFSSQTVKFEIGGSHAAYMRRLAGSIASLSIADVVYARTEMPTWRPIEGKKSANICFMGPNADPHRRLFNKTSLLYVDGAVELQERLKMIRESTTLRQELLEEQNTCFDRLQYARNLISAVLS
jgi:hypothetical protein